MIDSNFVLQPVHNTNPGGNGSGGSNNSQELFHCNASSSDSNAMVTEDGTDPKPVSRMSLMEP